MEMTPERKEKLYKIIKIVLIVFVAVIIANGFSCHDKNNNQIENTISFSGHGEVSAVPDIANIDFSISKDAKTVKEAQAEVAKVEASVLEFLKTSGVVEKDIKTTGIPFYPKYEYKYDTKVCAESNCPPPTGKDVIVGYTSNENMVIKIRNTDDVGKIVEGLGTLGVSNLNGPNFAIDKEDSFKDSARKLAINDAKEKAKTLSKDLGVRLGKISSFNENSNYPVPMYAKSEMMATADAGSAAPAVVPKGENLITSDVTITYEIR